MAVRLELTQRTGVFAQLANAMAEENASLGAVDIVSATRTKVIRDVTVDVQSEEHGERVLKRLNMLPDVRVIASFQPDPVAVPQPRHHRGTEQGFPETDI